MPEVEKNEFKFPDENAVTFEKTEEPEIELEIEDDTPPEDRGRKPLPEPLKEELEKDDLEAYDEEVKIKLKQMRKVWHDERREKEAADRERQEALRIAQALVEENKRIKTILDTGGREYANTLQHAAKLELEKARKEYKEAYDSGDSDAVMAAQEKLTDASLRVRQAENFRMPPLQQEEYVVQNAPSIQEAPRPVNPKLEAWQERNTWYGKDDEMTAAALGLHEKLKKTGEVQIGSDEYYAILDKTIRRRFPEYFEEDEVPKAKTETRTRPSTVVAPAVRSTAPQRIRLKQSQVNIAKRLGLTPQQYAVELSKLEAQNG